MFLIRPGQSIRAVLEQAIDGTAGPAFGETIWGRVYSASGPVLYAARRLDAFATHLFGRTTIRVCGNSFRMRAATDRAVRKPNEALPGKATVKPWTPW